MKWMRLCVVALKTKSSPDAPAISTSTELVAASAINLITRLISQTPAALWASSASKNDDHKHFKGSSGQSASLKSYHKLISRENLVRHTALVGY